MAITKERIEKFKKLVEEQKNKEINIVVTQIDPDAMASACSLAYIFKKLRENENGIKIFYCGSIGLDQNKAIFAKYNLERIMSPISELGDRKNKNIVLVDSSKIADSRLPPNCEVTPFIIIDHHRDGEKDEKEDQFFWIEDMGSASTLIIELADSLEIEFEMEEGQSLATMLALGIYTDTKAMVNTSKRDQDAYSKITPFVDFREFKELINYKLRASHFSNMHFALGNMEQKGPKLVTGIGVVNEDDGDDLALIADYLIRKDGVSLVIVWGIIDNTVRISARSSNLGNPLNDFLKKRFGEKSAGAKLTPDGLGEGGALITFDLGQFTSLLIGNNEVKAKLNDLIKTFVKEFVFRD